MKFPLTSDSIVFAIAGAVLIALAYLATREKQVIDTLPPVYSDQDTGVSGPSLAHPVPEPNEPKAGASQTIEYTSESVPNVTPDFQAINVVPVSEFHKQVRFLEQHEKHAATITPHGQRSKYGPEPSTFFQSDNFIGMIQ